MKLKYLLPVIVIITSYWSCYDYATNHTEQNPEWGVVTLSNHKFFYGRSHIVNYKIHNDTLTLHDSQTNHTWKVYGFEYDNSYYHFWVNETPIRNYRFLRDNRGDML